jgi:hypothetical protein
MHGRNESGRIEIRLLPAAVRSDVAASEGVHKVKDALKALRIEVQARRIPEDPMQR